MSYVDSETLDQIKSTLDIVDLVGEYVVLKQRGRNFTGLCPFHSEKTPSFTVSPDKQIFYCFGCGEGGDIFSFLMKHEHLDFPEAVNVLAKRAGVSIETKMSEGKVREQKFEILYEINRMTAGYFYSNLISEQGKQAVSYLLKRQVDNRMCKNFALGFSMDSWDGVLAFLESKGFKPEEIDRAGLVIAREKGTGYFDRFRKRIMFPIQDVRGRFIGFGGRSIDGSEPKYLNSPETEIFQKKLNLYGLKQALPEIRRTGRALVMEGYMDVISAHQHGHTNAVASLGTAFTTEQARMLNRYAKEVVFAYDNDTAGQQAVLRGLDVLEDFAVHVKVLIIPTGKDPDDFLRGQGSSAFDQLITRALSAFEYRLKIAIENHEVKSVQGKVEAVEQLLPTLAKVKSVVERGEYIKLVARKLDIREEALYQELKAIDKVQKTGAFRDKTDNFRHNIEESSYRPKSRLIKLEHDLLKMVLEHPELVLLVEKEIDFANFTDPKVPNIFRALKEVLLTETTVPDVMKILGYVNGEEEKQLTLRLSALEPFPYNDQIVEDLVKSYKIYSLKQQEKQLGREISEAEKEGNLTSVHELTLMLMELQKQIQSLK